MERLIKKTAKKIAGSKHVVALTGAGISVESGIPPFRGKGGLWEKIDPMEYAHIDAFNSDPAKVWNVLLKEMKRVLDTAKPNDAHLGLARLEDMGKLKTIITQNIDGLHQAAGNRDVIEFHGSFARFICIACRNSKSLFQIDMNIIPPLCECGGIFRPDVVFFGEMIPPVALMRSRNEASSCDLMLVIGTSATVQPASLMPVIAKQAGAVVVEINPEPTPLTGSISDYIIKGPAGKIMRRIVEETSALLERNE